MTDRSDLVLVTGGSGYVASYCIARLLRDGYRVRTTVRSEGKEWQVRDQVATAGAESASSLSFVVADLTDDAGWAEAMRGCRYVLHVASPFPLDVPTDEDELITPAREGTLRVLRSGTARCQPATCSPRRTGPIRTPPRWGRTASPRCSPNGPPGTTSR